MPRKHLIFDVDGVLSESGKGIKNTMVEMLAGLNRRGYTLHIVTGGTIESLRRKNYQFNYLCEHLHTLYGCLGNEIYIPRTGHWFHRNGDFRIPQIVREKLHKHWLFLSANRYGYYQKFLECFETRTGMVNFSLIDRRCSNEEKHLILNEYGDYRPAIIEELKEYRDQVLTGGLTSIDFTCAGKEQVMGDILNTQANSNLCREDILSVQFFGDRIESPGNDFRLAFAVENYGFVAHKVSSPDETWEHLAKLMGKELEQITRKDDADRISVD